MMRLRTIFVLLVLLAGSLASATTITNIAVASSTGSSATISWTTSTSATSQVEYGLNGATSQSTTTDQGLVTSHSVVVSGLTANLVYTYKVVSIDSSGSTTSGSNTFQLCSGGGPTAGYSNVSGTVGIPYGSGQVSAVWVNDSGVSTTAPTVCGNVFPTTFNSVLTPAGSISLALPDNNIILPSPGRWTINVANATGTTGQFSVTTPITGQSVGLTSQLQAAATGQLQLIYYDPATGVFDPPIIPSGGGQGNTQSVSILPSVIGFGQVQDATTSTVNLIISNTGTLAVNMTFQSFSNSVFSSASNTICDGLLPARASCIFPVTFSPLTAVSQSGTLTFRTDIASSPVRTITLSGTGTAVASHPLIVTATDNGLGTIVSSEATPQISCTIAPPAPPAGKCSTNYPDGTPFTLTATAGAASVLQSLTGGTCSTSPCNLVMASPGFTITADFSLNAPASTAQAAVGPNTLPFGQVQTNTTAPAQSVTISNPSATLPLTVNSAVLTGSTTFTATNIHACDTTLDPGAVCIFPIAFRPTSGIAFTGTVTFNTNAPIDPQNPLTSALSGSGTATATFPVTVSGFGLGSGTVVDTNNASSINATIVAGVCSGVCTFNYPTGTGVILTATADAGSVFNIFQGASLTTSPGSFTVTQAQTVSATFDIIVPTFTLTVSCAGQGTGTVTSSDSQISATCTGGVLTGTGQGTYSAGAMPILTESPSGGCLGGACTFNSWGGAQGTGGTNCNTGTTCTPTINTNTNVSASFALAAAGAPLQLIQKISGGTQGTNNITGTFSSAQQVGDTNIVSIQLNDATTTVSSVTDSAGNTYGQLGGGCSPKAGNGFTTAVYIANNIVAAAAGTNVVTAALSASPGYRGMLAHEYSGLQNPPLDVCNGATGGGSGNINAGNLVTTNASDLLFSTTVVGGGINTPSTGWTQQISFKGNDTEDRVVAATGTYNNLAPQTGVGFSSIDAAFKTTTTVPVTFSFNILCAGSGSGTVTTSGISVTCTGGVQTGTSSAQVAPSTILSVVATPSGAGSSLSGLSGAGCAGVSPCATSSITTNTTVTATFSAAGQLAYFVNKSTGSNSNSGLCAVAGTPSGCTGPWLTVAKAASTLQVGATGTVVTVAHNAASYGETVTLSKSGTANARIVFKCDAQWTVGGTTGCNGVLFNTYNVNFVDVGAINKFGFEMTNPGGQVAVNNVANFGNCSVTGFTGACNVGNSVHVIGNYIHAVATGACPSSGAILAGQHGRQQSDFQASGNLIDQVGTGASCGLMHGIYTATPGVKIQNNVILRVAGGAIQDYDQACSGVISNNTLLNGHFGIILYGGNGCTPGFNTVSNNIIDNMTGAAIYNGFSAPSGACSSGKNTLYSNNILNGNGAQWQQPQTGCEIRQNTLSEAPATTFVSYTGTATGNYQLNPGSIAVNGWTTQSVAGGASPSVPSVDMVNVARPQRQNGDIGALELP